LKEIRRINQKISYIVQTLGANIYNHLMPNIKSNESVIDSRDNRSSFGAVNNLDKNLEDVNNKINSKCSNN